MRNNTVADGRTWCSVQVLPSKGSARDRFRTVDSGLVVQSGESVSAPKRVGWAECNEARRRRAAMLGFALPSPTYGCGSVGRSRSMLPDRTQRLRHPLAGHRLGSLEFLREDGHAPFL